jgi:Glycosyl transferase family 2
VTTSGLAVFSYALNSPIECLHALKSLARQTVSHKIEVIVFAPYSPPEFESFGDQFASFKVVEPTGRTFGELFSQFLDISESPYLAYLEEHSEVYPDWAEKLLDAHHSNHPVVGFSLENGNPESVVSWVHLAVQFGHVAAPLTSGSAEFLAGHHVSYSRGILTIYRSELVSLMEDETAFFLRLRKDGVSLFLSGEALSVHLHLARLNELLHLEYHGQKSFAATRATQPGWSAFHSLLYTLAAPLIPLIRLSRIYPHLRRLQLLKRFGTGFMALTVLVMTVGTVGEVAGYWFGPGSSPLGKTRYEFERRNLLGLEERASEDRCSPKIR